MTTTDDTAPGLDGSALFLLDEVPDVPELLVDGAEGRHAVDVLRLAPGERVRVGDGPGQRRVHDQRERARPLQRG